MADITNLDLTNATVQFGYKIVPGGTSFTYTYDSTTTGSGEIVFVQGSGDNDGVIFINDKQFSVRKSEFDSLKNIVDSITGEGGTSINLTGLEERLHAAEEELIAQGSTDTELLQSIYTLATSVNNTFGTSQLYGQITTDNTVGSIIDAIGTTMTNTFGTSEVYGQITTNNTVGSVVDAINASLISLASSIASTDEELKTISLNDVSFINNDGDWVGTLNASNIKVSEPITSNIGTSIPAGSSLQEALSTINDRVNILLGTAAASTAFDTIKEISDYLDTHNESITDLTRLQQRVATAEANITTITSNLSEATSQIATNSASIDLLAGSLTGLVNNLSGEYEAVASSYITGITIGDNGSVTLATSALNATSITFKTEEITGEIDLSTENTINEVIHKLAKGVKDAQTTASAAAAGGVLSLTTHGLIENSVNGTSGDVIVNLYGTTIEFGATTDEGQGLIQLLGASTITENVSALNTAMGTAVATITTAIGTLSQDISALQDSLATVIAENLTWHMIPSGN